MGKVCLCWVTVILWVRVAFMRNVGSISRGRFWCGAFCVNNRSLSGKTLRHEFSLHYISVFSVDSVFKKFFLSMTKGLVTYKKFQSECLHANRA